MAGVLLFYEKRNTIYVSIILFVVFYLLALFFHLNSFVLDYVHFLEKSESRDIVEEKVFLLQKQVFYLCLLEVPTIYFSLVLLPIIFLSLFPPSHVCSTFLIFFSFFCPLFHCLSPSFFLPYSVRSFFFVRSFFTSFILI